MKVKNIAFYKFVGLEGLHGIRDSLQLTCRELGLSGTILLAPEGINGFLAGFPENIDAFCRFLVNSPHFQDLEFKASFSGQIPFRKMRVKLKKEIIPLGKPEVRPDQSTGIRLRPSEFFRWLQEGREICVLDVRNDYEVGIGYFENALSLNLKRFRDFPARLREIPHDLRERPVVMYCTGGIRCEKASAMALQSGFKEVYQLDGGILKYFEECGGKHFRGNCFVFDERIALNEGLEEADAMAGPVDPPSSLL